MKKTRYAIFLSFLMWTAVLATAAGFAPIGAQNPIPMDANGGVPVNVQDQTTPPLDLYFVQMVGIPTTLASNSPDPSTNPRALVLTDDTTFTDGTYVGVFSGTGRYYFGEQQGAPVANGITVDTPLDYAFPAGSNVLPFSRELNVDGSVTPQVFQISAGDDPDLEIDITRIMIQMETDGLVQLDRFGDIIGGLINGLVLRRKDGVYRNVWNVKKNSEFANLAYDFNIFTAASGPTGINGFSTRITFAGPSKHGVAIRLGADESLELIVQDDLTGLTSFRVMAQGHEVDADYATAPGNPTTFDCPANVWTKVANGVTRGSIMVRDNNETSANEQPRILYYMQGNGDAAPTDGDPSLGVELQYPGMALFGDETKDLYVYPEFHPGKVIFYP